MENNKKEIKKKNNSSGGLYIALAICILSVICIGVYSAIINIFHGDDIDIPVIEAPETKEETPKTTKKTDQSKNNQSTENKKEENKPVAKEDDKGEEVTVKPEIASFTKPVGGNVLKEFSSDVLVYSETMNDYRNHYGVDLQANIGDPVKCFANGIIEKVYEDPLMGETVVVDHGDNLKSVYSNLSPELPQGIEVGKTVKEGEVIGGVGETCLIECAEASHLHFEVISEGNNINPMEYFK